MILYYIMLIYIILYIYIYILYILYIIYTIYYIIYIYYILYIILYIYHIIYVCMCLFHTMQQLQRVLRNGLWHSVLFASICWDGLLSSAKLMIEQIWLCSEIQLQKISLFVSRCIICTYIYIYVYISLYTFSVSTPTVQNHRNQKEGTGLRFGLDTNPCKIFKLSMICVSRTSSQVSKCLSFRYGSLWIAMD